MGGSNVRSASELVRIRQYYMLFFIDVFDFGIHCLILYGILDAWEVSKNLRRRNLPRGFRWKRYDYRRSGPLFLKMGFVGSVPWKNPLGAHRRFVYTGSDFLSFGSVLGSRFPNDFSKTTEGLLNIEVSERIPGSRLSRGSRGFPGSGGSKRAPDPTFHTRRGSG